ncbi:MAG: hypothetical protein U0T69_11955 [Chitinophagales bacterium]
MKKNYFNLPIELFKQILTKNLKLNMSEEDTSNLDTENIEVVNLDRGRIEKIHFYFSVHNLLNNSLKIEIYRNGTKINPSITLTPENPSIILTTGVTNDGANFEFRFLDSNNVAIHPPITDSIDDNVEIIDLGVKVRAHKFCWIKINNNLLQAPTINMFPPTK